jgi:hypothetical protein
VNRSLSLFSGVIAALEEQQPGVGIDSSREAGGASSARPVVAASLSMGEDHGGKTLVADRPMPVGRLSDCLVSVSVSAAARIQCRQPLLQSCHSDTQNAGSLHLALKRGVRR